MNDRRENPKTSPLGTLLGVVAIVLVTYPLSTGPMVWLAEHGDIAHDNAFFIAIYNPLVLLSQ